LAVTPSSTPKTAVVTGASSGIGRVVARELAMHGYRVIAHGRNPARSKEALAEIRRAAPTAQVQYVLADLSIIAEVRRAANEIASLTSRIDLLVNNAGAIYSERRVTPDGFEATFAGNHLGPFVLTQTLMPLLRVAVLANGEARIINTASQAHQMIDDMAWDDLQLEKGYRSWKAYAQSKLANILFTRELARREVDNRLFVNAVHPGVVDTNFPAGGGLLTRAGWLFMKPFTKTPDQGADTILWLATKEAQDSSGGYYEKRRPAPMTRAALSAEGARRLWEVSEQMVSERR
jgi:retinol dehydrogenase-12